MAEREKAVETHLECEVCRHREASFQCLDCGKRMCVICVLSHHAQLRLEGKFTEDTTSLTEIMEALIADAERP